MHGSDLAAIDELIGDLEELRSDLLQIEQDSRDLLDVVAPSHAAGARNLLHYLALRRHDLRGLQVRLAGLGLSSLGRAEEHVLASLEAVLGLLHLLARRVGPRAAPRPIDLPALSFLDQHTQSLLGQQAAARSVRIMVTMPGDAAVDYTLVRDLLAGGMDCMRINCAHDDPETWGRMIGHLRQAEKEVGRSCRVLMDLPGPKLRTGPLEPGPRVVKCRPQRDRLGRVMEPARVWLTPADAMAPPPRPAAACLPVAADWLARLAVGARVNLRDARDAKRMLRVVEAVGPNRWCTLDRTTYITSGTVLHRYQADNGGHSGTDHVDTPVCELPAIAVPLVLRSGDTLILTRAQQPGRPGQGTTPAQIACTLPDVLADLCPGQQVWFDDGKIGGIIRAATPEEARVEIIRAEPKGSKLGADKGINLPDTALRLPPLTEQDLEFLPFVVAHADLVGFSFVRQAADVIELQTRLAELGGQHLGLVLKIETAPAFDHLPELLLAAMRGPCVGVMIARGDLAIECGWERLAELQEEILWVCQAAHVPVIWATQVLEHLAKEGMPSRAEITDAAMGERAECVMLNKGPHIREAVRVLDDIMRRMEGHQNKKRPMLRRLNLANNFPAKPAPTTLHPARHA